MKTNSAFLRVTLLLLFVILLQPVSAGDFCALNLKNGHEGIWCDKLNFDGNEMTLEMWLMIDSSTSDDGVIIASCRNDMMGWGLQLDWGIWIKFSFRTPSGGWADLLIPRADFVGKWGHLAVSISATENSIIYVNGIAQTHPDSNKKIDGGYYGNDKNSQALQIGNWYDDTKPVAKFADIRIWKTNRTAGQIAENYNKYLSGSQPDLYLNYKFDQVRRDIKSATGDNNTGYLNPETNWDDFFQYEVLAQMPTNVTLSQNMTDRSVTVTWEGNADTWDVELIDLTASLIYKDEVSVQSKTFNQLESGNSYQVKVRAKKIVYSDWTSPAEFTLGTSNHNFLEIETTMVYNADSKILNFNGTIPVGGICLFDSNGILVENFFHNEISLASIPTGIYFVKAGEKFMTILK